jgi:ring-1,2-phenylacetyl-CoA epoxidase subunit PaaD
MEQKANSGQAKWGQIKIQDDHVAGSESAGTKFCSDPTLRSASLATKSATKPDATLEKIWQLLEQVPDPEVPVVSIRELGILRDVRYATGGSIEIVITPTYSGCPAMGQIEDDVQAALQEAGLQAKVVTQLAPAWTTDWMLDAAKAKLRAYGIAPPQCSADGTHLGHVNTMNSVAAPAIIQRARGPFGMEIVPCPRCNSHNTTETSHFASTACKALYKCLDCLEPFDYFKPY